MQILASQIFIKPFTLSPQGERFNTYEYDRNDSEINGWNVQVFGLINGTAGIIDDGDFPDINAAFAHALELSHRYQIPIHCMDDAFASDAGQGHDAVDDVAQILPALAA